MYNNAYVFTGLTEYKNRGKYGKKDLVIVEMLLQEYQKLNAETDAYFSKIPWRETL